MNQAIRQSGEHRTTSSLEVADRDRILMAMGGDRLREKLAIALSSKDSDALRMEVERAFPWSKPGGGIVEYSIEMGNDPGGALTLYARLNPGGRDDPGEPIEVDSVPLGRRERNQFISGLRAIYLPDPDVMLSVFPLDYRMPWLADLLDPVRMTEVLQEPLCRALDVDRFFISGRPDLLGYRYGRRCTLLYRLQVPDPEGGGCTEIPVIGKTQYDDGGRETFQQLEQLWNRPFKASNSRPPITPRPLCHLPGYKIYFQEAEVGDRIYDIMDGESRYEAMVGAAALLSSFHRSGLVVGGSHGPDDEIALLGRWIEYLEVIHPGLKETSRDALSRLRSRAEDRDIHEYEPVIVHRDFFDKQVIRSDGLFYMIDMDTVTMSDPAIDVGNFIAHIFLRAIQRGCSRESIAHDSNVFVSAYLEYHPPVDPKRIMFYASASLFRLACLYAYRPRWNHLPAMLLEEIRLRLNGSWK